MQLAVSSHNFETMLYPSRVSGLGRTQALRTPILCRMTPPISGRDNAGEGPRRSGPLIGWLGVLSDRDLGHA